MIPSLAATELREAIVEYLSTTFAIGDEETRGALIDFLTDDTDGIFRGPFLRVRTPFKRVDPAWLQRSPLDWMPKDFQPFEHQAKAFERLGSRDGEPQPTLVTTGTGSGKTECFLTPILDHCARAVHAGQPGIKALILYPMNALASDQAGRIARTIHEHSELAGVRAGIFVGGESSGTSVMTESRIIDDQHTLRSAPPDILLTNYKMLDFLLLRDTDRELWAETGAGVLRYLVLDEFHTYDGAQGTDVAMLLRRLGVTLGLGDSSHGPLGSVAPVATSATLGDSAAGADALREFAESVFGRPFQTDSVIVERRESVNDCCKPVDWDLPAPEIDDLRTLDGTDMDDVAAAFIGRTPGSAVDLGDTLLAHRMTRAVLGAVGGRPTPVADAIEEIALRVSEWGPHLGRDRRAVEHAVALYLGLLSVARRPGPSGGSPVPLFSVEVQLWIREVSRVTRLVQAAPEFRWLDGAAPEPEELPEEEPPPTAPAIYCRLCGRTGWMARSSEMNASLSFVESGVYEDSVRSSPRLRALIRSSSEEAGVQYLDPDHVALHVKPRPACLPVLVTPGDDEARRSECPSCGGIEGIRFVGSRVASLASVSISQLFGSELVDDGERKLLAFTDSVQDAAHRAAFFNGRTHRFNQRIAITSIVKDSQDGRLTLAELGPELMRAAASSSTPAEEFYELVPPDLLRHFGIRTLWDGEPKAPGASQILGRRVEFETHLEFGLRARLGRTIELTGALAAEVPVTDIDHLAALVIEARDDLVAQIELVPETESFEDPKVYLRGLLERTRLQGAIFHPWLKSYVKDEGRRYLIWGGRPDGLPAFPSGQSAPTFLIDAQGSPFDALESRGGSPVWTADWASRTLRLPLGYARDFTRVVLTLLAAEDVISTQKSTKGNTIYGLEPSGIAVHDVPTGDSPVLRCRVCAHRHAAPLQNVAIWDNAPCLRYRCPGRYEPIAREASAYYRRLYRSGTPRRTVAAEHTGGLDRQTRERLENAFKHGHAPGTPNVLACTPTLEMGVDIGDLSAVMLTSVPRSSASYVQRVGRAGRASGNALVTTFVRTEPRSLYFLTDPRHMIAGVVRPPSCWLDAIEILRRQYVAFVLDRAADGSIPVAAMPQRIGGLVKDSADMNGVLRTILATHHADPASYVNTFLKGFGRHVSKATAERLRDFAKDGFDDRVLGRLGEWDAEYKDLQLRRDRLTKRIKDLQARSTRTEDEEFELKSLLGERKATIGRFQKLREEYTPTALERLGLLPNYTLVDHGVTLNVALWAPTADGDYRTENIEYKRPATLAIRELAPGARFYAGGHRVIVDALDLGPASEPAYERWWLCPECGYGTADQGAPGTCPRCSSPSIADAQSRHLVLPFTGSSAQSSEENARISDDTEDRERTPFTIVTTVDVDPDDVRPERAWRARNEDQPFGFEYAVATLRWLNVGHRDKPGDSVSLGGRDDIRASRFETCRYCGVVQSVPETFGRTPPAEGFHRGWCLTRSSARNPEYDRPILAHELRTDVVRIALPLADFEVDERLASFRAALLFGLQLHFGGTPDHLRAVVSDAPGGSDGGRRRFLVIHDIVPGGTGYLERLADPEALKGILEVARGEIARCPCKDEGRAACHRCLLGHADHGEADIVSRRLALELLDELLRDWDLIPVPTIGNLPIGAVEESELERRLRAALIAWGERTEGASVTKQPGAAQYPDLELRVPSVDGEQLLRWRIREQHDLDTSPPTRPDFLIERVDGNARAIALYSDGFQYHASPAKRTTLADDARKRHGVRASGRLAWSMDWKDVEDFRRAVTADIAKQPPNLELLDSSRRKTAETVQHQRGGKLSIDTLERNPLRMLLNYLADPVEEDWRRLARSAVAGAMSGLTPDTGEGVAAFHSSTMNGARFDATLNTAGVAGANGEAWTVRLVLADDADGVHDTDHRDRWRDWLHWGNVLQFLDGDGCQALITTASIEPDVAVDLDAVGPTAPEPAVADDVLPDDVEAEIALADGSVQSLLRAVAADPRARGFVVGEETDDGGLIEVAWPDSKVAVLIDGQEAPEGWTAHPVAEWDPPTLVEAVAIGQP
ncbi:DEAD/DEAH box helicase [Baekduia soli]|uniref:DEAD/DEAH box helicase n=1 Tax=Baekduia soli TaxID=496014 RepID=A0A5B8U2P9_9ACTN|nr:DEAD/DEAH box helicase [Baekduia soli]QEC47296.1 DEAD/DEAH box helicase [Baekduia soli]